MWNYVESLTQGKHQSSETALLPRRRRQSAVANVHEAITIYASGRGVPLPEAGAMWR